MTTSPTLPGGEKAVIRIRGLRNAFGDEGEQVIHDDLDLDVKRGEILGVVGGSGTGKSVLMGCRPPRPAPSKFSARA
jgi:phospholipid/cholesterol/gamma-HCH transport system ATP-binding protein